MEFSVNNKDFLHVNFNVKQSESSSGYGSSTESVSVRNYSWLTAHFLMLIERFTGNEVVAFDHKVGEKTERYYLNYKDVKNFLKTSANIQLDDDATTENVGQRLSTWASTAKKIEPHYGTIMQTFVSGRGSANIVQTHTRQLTEFDTQQIKQQIKDDLLGLSADYKEKGVSKENVLGLMVFRGQSGAFCIQEKSAWDNKKADEAIVSVNIDTGEVRVNGKSLEEITDQTLLDQASATIVRLKLNALFKKHEEAIPNHTEAVFKVSDRYIAKTKIGEDTIIFIQDQNAWDGNKGGESFSINMATHTIKRNGELALLSSKDLAFVEKYLNNFKNAEKIEVTERRGGGMQVDVFDDRNSQSSRTAPPLPIPGLRYTGEAELAARSIYLNELEGTKISYDSTYGVVSIDYSSKVDFDASEFKKQIEVWFSSMEENETIITFNNSDGSKAMKIELDEDSKKITIKGADYARLINYGGDRWVARFGT